MKQMVPMTFWNYNQFCNFKMEMLHDWVNCGLTAPVTPMFQYGKDSDAEFIAMLDEAERLGVEMILQIDAIFIENVEKDEKQYCETVSEVYEKFGAHPAVAGVYVGEEPNISSNDAYHKAVKILRQLMPGKVIFVNMGTVERTERMLLQGKISLEDWICGFARETKTDVLGYGTYSQMQGDGSGIDEHFQNIRDFVTAGKKAGLDIWASLLSSAHYAYRVPTEDDYRWQINTAVACGCRAVVWFRLYDKLIASDLHGSPIDEFGEKTTHYYDLARVQKRFNAHHAKLFARLTHLETYGVGVSYGGYHYFLQGTSDLIESAVCRSGMLSFFKDEDGVIYAVVVNTLQREACTIALSFTEKVNHADIIYLNGDKAVELCDRGDRKGIISSGEIWLAPGQMEVIRLS